MLLVVVITLLLGIYIAILQSLWQKVFTHTADSHHWYLHFQPHQHQLLSLCSRAFDQVLLQLRVVEHKSWSKFANSVTAVIPANVTVLNFVIHLAQIRELASLVACCVMTNNPPSPPLRNCVSQIRNAIIQQICTTTSYIRNMSLEHMYINACISTKKGFLGSPGWSFHTKINTEFFILIFKDLPR